MEKSNQLPKTEDCSAEGEPVDLLYYRVKRPSRSVSRDKREPQAGPASCQQFSFWRSWIASHRGMSTVKRSMRRVKDSGVTLAGRFAATGGWAEECFDLFEDVLVLRPSLARPIGQP